MFQPPPGHYEQDVWRISGVMKEPFKQGSNIKNFITSFNEQFGIDQTSQIKSRKIGLMKGDVEAFIHMKNAIKAMKLESTMIAQEGILFL